MSIMNNRRGDREPANLFMVGSCAQPAIETRYKTIANLKTANSQFAHIWSRKGVKPSDLRPGTSTPEVRCPKSVIRSLTSDVQSPKSEVQSLKSEV